MADSSPMHLVDASDQASCAQLAALLPLNSPLRARCELVASLPPGSRVAGWLPSLASWRLRRERMRHWAKLGEYRVAALLAKSSLAY